MEILNNFSSIYCFITFVIGAVFMLAIYSIEAMGKSKEPRNKVHFYLVQTSFMKFELFLGYPTKNISDRGVYWTGNRMYVDRLIDYGINLNDYSNLKYDKPVEVFLNLED